MMEKSEFLCQKHIHIMLLLSLAVLVLCGGSWAVVVGESSYHKQQTFNVWQEEAFDD